MTLKRRIKLGMYGLDVKACKRGMARAGYGPKFGDWHKLTDVFGPFSLVWLSHLQHDHGIKNEPKQIGPKTFFVIQAHMDALAKSWYAAYKNVPPPPPVYYVNMFRNATGLVAERTDQGVDYGADADAPIGSPGRSRVIRAATNSGWPGPYNTSNGFGPGGEDHGGVIQAVFLEGPLKGMPWYLAEFIHVDVKVDQIVHAGQHIARFYYDARTNVGVECGWLQPGSNSPCSHDLSGVQTSAGKAWARFLRSTGCPTQQNPGPGPMGNPCGRQ